MSNARIRRGLLVTALVAVTGCAQPLMAVPEGFATGVDVLTVSGRHGTFLIESQISFGPFRTVYIHRGFSPGGGGVSNGPGLATGLSSENHSSDRKGFDFVLQGPGSGPWRG
ncbi:MAG: hypothetical protein ACREJ3_17280, partial [Polyangiaceae bacterium]